MTYQDIIASARGNMGFCAVCAECNGKACKNRIPGPGAKGIGDVAIRNYDVWKAIRINMDTIHENFEPDTAFDFFGKTLKYPIIAGPVGAVQLHYGNQLDDPAYNDILIKGADAAGITAFTGDGTDPAVMSGACAAIKASGGNAVPTVKPWDVNTLQEKFALVKDADPYAVAMDIDAAGLPFLQNLNPPAGAKSVEELRAVIEMSGKPFIIKGVMTPRAAMKAYEAGAAAIVVSNHGGRVLDQCPATAEVLAGIVKAVKGRMKIFVDGGIRSGADVFKAIAMGADAVLIARPYVTAVYGGGVEGVQVLTEKLGSELKDTMKMCGAASLADIDGDKIFC